MSVIAIKTIKKLPKTCFKCPFLRHEYSFLYDRNIDTCGTDNSIIFCDTETQKPSWCPLYVIKEEKK